MNELEQREYNSRLTAMRYAMDTMTTATTRDQVKESVEFIRGMWHEDALLTEALTAFDRAWAACESGPVKLRFWETAERLLARAESAAQDLGAALTAAVSERECWGHKRRELPASLDALPKTRMLTRWRGYVP